MKAGPSPASRSSVQKPIRTEDLLQALSTLSGSLRPLVEALPSSPTELQVWSAYAEAERIVAILKFRMRAERPGVFSNPPKKPQAELLSTALETIDGATIMMRDGRLLEALETLRTGRDHLRAYLSEERRSRMKSKRGARPRSTSS